MTTPRSIEETERRKVPAKDWRDLLLEDLRRVRANEREASGQRTDEMYAIADAWAALIIAHERERDSLLTRVGELERAHVESERQLRASQDATAEAEQHLLAFLAEWRRIEAVLARAHVDLSDWSDDFAAGFAAGFEHHRLGVNARGEPFVARPSTARQEPPK
jgi:hypothetical protein